MSTRKCRVCACTEWRACVDIFGDACYWVGPDLCSACRDGRDPDSDADDTNRCADPSVND